MSMMTQDIRQALSKSRYESSPNPSSRSRADSVVTAGSSRRSSFATSEDMPYIDALSLTADGQGQGPWARRKSGGGAEDEEMGHMEFDPGELEHVRRLGEGTGGAVELVRDQRSGRIMAKKASFSRDASHRRS